MAHIVDPYIRLAHIGLTRQADKPTSCAKHLAQNGIGGRQDPNSGHRFNPRLACEKSTLYFTAYKETNALSSQPE